MAKRMVKIKKQNKRMMKVPSQLLGDQTSSIVEHKNGYAASPFVEKIIKDMLSRSLTLLILTATYDG